MVKAYAYLEKIRPFRAKNLMDGKITFIDGSLIHQTYAMKFLQRAPKHKLLQGMVLSIVGESKIIRKRQVFVINSWEIINQSLINTLFRELGIKIEKDMTTDEEFLVINKTKKEFPDKIKKDVYDIYDLLQEAGLNYSISMAWYIVNYFSRRAKIRNFTCVYEMVRFNPLILNEMSEFPFNIGNHILKHLHIEVNFETLVYSKIVQIVCGKSKNGNSYTPISHIITLIPEIKNHPDKVKLIYEILTTKTINKSMANLSISRLFKEEASAFYETAILRDGTVDQKNKLRYYGTAAKSGIYMSSVYFAEKQAAELFSKRLGKDSVLTNQVVIKEIEEFSLNGQQIEAIENALNYKTSIIIGQAGSGKTHTISALISLLKKNGRRVMVLAPSAIAASSTGIKAGLTQQNYQTIHRFARIIKDEDIGIAQKRQTKITYEELNCIDFIIIDEMSMNNILVFCELLYAIQEKPNLHLVLVGDTMQLSSIGPGGHFHHLVQQVIDSGYLPIVELTSSYRSKEDTNILEVALGIRNKGEFMDVNSRSSIQIFENSVKKLINIVNELTCIQKVEFKDILILSDRRIGVAGTDALNQMIRKTIFPEVFLHPIANSDFYVGDKIIAKVNDYVDIMSKHLLKIRHEMRGKDVFNGMRGTISSFDQNSDTVLIQYVDFSGTFTVPYRAEELNLWIESAYAITVHKAQGCEAKHVIFILSDEKRNLKQNILYTAFTRAKEKIYLFSDINKIKKIAGNKMPIPYSKFGFIVNEHMKKAISLKPIKTRLNQLEVNL